MGEAITTLEGCTRLFSQRGTGGGMQAADTNALSRETPTGIGGLQAEDSGGFQAEDTDALSRETPLQAEDTGALSLATLTGVGGGSRVA